jgi:hypothetical protein
VGIIHFLVFRKKHELGCSETHVLSRVFGTKKYETQIGWIKLHDKELDNFQLSNIIRMLKPRRMG